MSPRRSPESSPPSSAAPAADAGKAARRHVRGLGVTLFVLAGLALLTPLASEQATARVGLLLVLAGLLEVYDGSRRARDVDARAALSSGLVTLLIGGVVLNATTLVSGVFEGLLAAWFLVDASRYGWRGWQVLHGRLRLEPRLWVLPLVGNLAVAAGILVWRERVLPVTVALTASLRILGAAWNVLAAPVLVATDAGESALSDLGLQDHPELQAFANQIEIEEIARTPYDREWIGGYLLTLFALHLGRMGLDRSVLGVLSPAVAVLGDCLIALLVATLLVTPSRLIVRRGTRPLERYAWALALGPTSSGGLRRLQRLARVWLESRLRFAVRLRQARYSPRAALRRGLRLGLPAAAVMAATVPVWGMSWYFDTENWAAGVWNSWAEARTDTWREAMIGAVERVIPVGQGAAAFAVTAPGVPAGGDFAFLVIGDTGEGDASQHVLRDVLWRAASQPDVRFVVLSSDVVYPTGAMKHYEANFWLPFKGVHVPVFAIPGNHDWYDALEGFAATFFQPEAARAAMRARIGIDQEISSTTDADVERLIAQAAALGRAYGVPVARQRAPFFQIQTETFALVAVDTGVARRLDPRQWAWLEQALRAARGKFVMAVLGHPLYAGGAYQAAADDDASGFAALHALLRRHGAAIVMAGDTHDLEYYEEPRGAAPAIRHIVNGGGGAYLSLGTALAWPSQPATARWAHYPGRRDVMAKIDASTPWWKRPAWWWTHRLGGWPFSAEWLSALFDSNQAPFFQSFVEVRVEPSQRRVRVLPWGVHGRLRWQDVDASSGLRPPDVAPSAPLEWIVPYPAPVAEGLTPSGTPARQAP